MTDMEKGRVAMRKRINITLPEETVKLLDRVAEKGDRSELINKAVRSFITQKGRANLRRQLKEGAIKWAARDLELAEEWFGIEEEAWRARAKK